MSFDGSTSRNRFCAATLGELEAFWLDLRCAPPCTKIVVMPLRLMAKRSGRQLALGAAIARLRCTNCGCAPATVRITDSPIGPGKHIAPVAQWSVSLAP